MFSHQSIKFYYLVILLTCFLFSWVLFLYPIPGTGSVRNVLFFHLLLMLFVIWKGKNIENDSLSVIKQQTYSVQSLLFLTGWMAVQTLLFGVDKFESLNNLLEEWLVGVLVFSWLGWVIASVSKNIYFETKLLTLIMFAMFAHVIWLFLYQVPIWQDKGSYPYGLTPYAERDFITIPVNLAFILLVSDLAAFFALRKRILVLPIWVVSVLMIISLIAIITVYTRNGVLSAAAALLLLAIIMGFKLWRSKYIFKSVIAVVI